MNSTPQPSIKSLLFACLLSIILAAIILLVAVLPAEFDIDPTGLGEKLGLTVLSKTVNDVKPSALSCSDHSTWQDTAMITVPAHKGVEYKFHVTKDEKINFSWHTASGIPLYFDFHGEPESNTTGYFKSYKVSTDHQSSGFLAVPFTGVHGWYWENKSNQAVVIILKTQGNYRVVGLL